MGYIEKTQSYHHQVNARRKGYRKKAFAYLMEMGTGKTKVDIDETCELFLDGEIDLQVVFAPKGVYMNWIEQEFPAHMPDAIRRVCKIVPWRAGAGPARALEELLQPFSGLRILVINVEAFSTGRRALDYVLSLMQTSKLGVKVTIDESPTIKNPSSDRTSGVMEIRKFSKYRRILTGNASPNSPMDLYSQFTWLDEKILGFTSFFSFRARYAVLKRQDFGGRKVWIIVAFKEIDGLNGKISPHSFRVLKSECLDLPPKIYQQKIVELTDDQARMYKELRRSATTQIEEGGPHVTATEVIVQMTRLHQLICGHVVDEEGNTHDVKSNRIKAMLEVIEDTTGKVIIWSIYRHDIEKIVEALSKEYKSTKCVVEYHGGISNDGRTAAINRFQKDPDCRFFVANAQTGGRGITLTAASTVIYYSNDFSLDNRMQSEDRAHRVGLDHSVNYVDLVTPNTLDIKVVKALRNKINISSVIMGDGFREWLI